MSSVDVLVHLKSQRVPTKHGIVHQLHGPTAPRKGNPVEQSRANGGVIKLVEKMEEPAVKMDGQTLTGLRKNNKIFKTGSEYDFSSYNEVPLFALGYGVRTQIAVYLNIISNLVTLTGRQLTPDYRGLAELAGFDHPKSKSLSCKSNPTQALLDDWKPTLGKLCEALLELGRFDVLDSIRSDIDRDVAAWIERKKLKEECKKTVAECDLFQPGEFAGRTDHHINEFVYMTLDDGPGKKMYYDAFVCYAREDIRFVKELARNLESPPYNLKLCIPDRDTLPGSSTHSVNARLIEDRCKRMVVVISPNYLKSPSCDFQTKFAQAIAEDARCKRIIPVLLEPCDIPTILRPLTLCDFTRGRVEKWFWNRVAKALENRPANLSFSSDFESPLTLNDLYLNLNGASNLTWSGTPCRRPSSDSLTSSGSLGSMTLSSKSPLTSVTPSPQSPESSSSKDSSMSTSIPRLSLSRTNDESDVVERLSPDISITSQMISDDMWTVIEPREIEDVRSPRRTPGLRLTADTECVYDVYADRVTLWPVRTTDSPEQGWPWDR